jgi:hypothetical protein
MIIKQLKYSDRFKIVGDHRNRIFERWDYNRSRKTYECYNESSERVSYLKGNQECVKV